MSAVGLRALSAAQAQRAQQVLALLRDGKAAEALPIADALAREAPDAVDAQQTLALCLSDCGDLAGAERAFRAALRLAPTQPAILANLATLLRRAGRASEALPLFRQAVEAAPQFAKGWLELGITALEIGDAAQAVAALTRALTLQPQSARGWQALGSAQRALDDLDAAEAAFAQAATLAPGSLAAWGNLGAVQRLQGRAVDALHAFERARQAGGDTPELADARTGALLDAGRIEHAHANAEQLLRAHPGYVPAQVTLANLLWEYGPALGIADDPARRMQVAARARPDHMPLQLACVGFLLQAKQADVADDMLQALRRRSDHPLLMTLHANALEMLGRRAESGSLYDAAHAALGGRDVPFLNAYARHLLATGRWADAAARAQDALRIDRHDQEAWAYLGTAWRLLGDPREFWLCDYERLIGVVDLESPSGFGGIDMFLCELRAALEPLHKAGREPVQQSLRRGSQTPGRLFGRPDPLIEMARVMLQHAAERWLAALPADDTHPFLARRRAGVRFSGSWSVKLWTSGKHANHIHSQGWTSSAFYVALPPSVVAPRSDADSAGCIHFGVAPDELGLDLPARRVVRPRPGRLALFPSYMWHGTVPFDDEAPRITIAFDMLPREA